MLNNQKLQIFDDLGIGVPFIKGQNVSVRKCWHFCTDGNAVSGIFQNDADFMHGMNRIYIGSLKFRVIILAFCLMDTHIHFILYGEYDQCLNFINEYLRATSRYLFFTYKEKHKLAKVPVSAQKITDDLYLKTAICYVLKNPTVAGIQFNPYDYPWSSAALYFRKEGLWTSPAWTAMDGISSVRLSYREKREILHTAIKIPENVSVVGNMVFPGEYVSYDIVEKIFRTSKSFSYFMGQNKEFEIEAREGTLSQLSMPLKELQQYRDEVLLQEFGARTLRSLDVGKRMKLAKILRSKYNCSVKQLCRVCGLNYTEVKASF